MREHGATGEAANATNDSAESALIDIAHDVLWRACVKQNFSLGRIRLPLNTYKGPVRIRTEKEVVADVAQVTRSIVAGCTFATAVLRAVLREPLTCIKGRRRSLGILVTVDDIASGAIGSCRHVERMASEAGP